MTGKSPAEEVMFKHFLAAEKCLEKATRWSPELSRARAVRESLLAEAQVHATLALIAVQAATAPEREEAHE